MKYTSAFIAALIFFCAPFSQAQAQDLISFGAGYYDINDNEDAADFRLEYRWDNPLIWVIEPMIGVEATSDGAVYANAGLVFDFDIADQWTFSPSFAAGLYGDGDGKDLGHTVEFRSQAEFGYKFADQSRFSVAFGHISNASLGDSNPGTEILNVYYHVPADWIFSR